MEGIKQQVDPSNDERMDCTKFESQLLTEYGALRSEIIHRMGIRHQILSLSIIVLGAVLALNAHPITLLAYPFLGFFLALGWAQNDYRIGEIGNYIRKHLENKLPGLYWERYLYEKNQNDEPFHYLLRANIISAGGMIVGTQVLAIVVFLIKRKSPEIHEALLVADCVAIGLTCIAIFRRNVLYKKRK